MEKGKNKAISYLLIIVVLFVTVFSTWTTIPARAAGNITIGGIDIGYALGDYFTKNGKECACHGRKTCGEASDCNCKLVSGCCQCYGFALWCENKLYGYNDRSNQGNFTDYGSISASNMSASTVKTLISKVPIGSHIRTGSNSYGVSHSMIITSKSDNGFTIVQANGSNNDNYSGHDNCRIGTTNYTWASYASSTYGKRGILHVWGKEGLIDPDPDPNFTKNTKYPVPFKGYPIATSGNIPVYSGKLNEYSNHYISASDLCTIEAVYTNGYCKVTYPTSSGSFTAYAKNSAFIASTDTPYSYKPEQNMTTYTRSNLSTTFGSVFATDNCTIVASGGSGKYQLIYPISSGYKIGWIQKTSVTPSQMVTPILGYNASASDRTPVYQYESTLGGTKYGEIFIDDMCTLNSVNIDKNWINVTYPISGGTKTGYVYFNQFFPSFVGKNNIYKTKVSANTTAYQKSNMSASIGTIYPSDSITVVGKSGSKIQVLYPITEGSNKGKYKLGWITSSNLVKNLQRIAVTSNPSKTTYLEGESLNTNGLAITAYYDDGSTSNITGSCSLGGYSSTPGTKTVTASYSGKTTAFTVVVNSKSPSTLTVTQMPSKTSYYVGEAFDQTGLKATVKYDNNTTADVSSEVYCSVEEDSFSTPGNKSILVQYLYNSRVVSTSITVKVLGREMSSGYNRRLPDGDYLIVSAADPSYFLDISGTDTSAADGTNVVLTGPLSDHPGAFDIWTLTYSDGFYSICQKNSNASLDVKDKSVEQGANVQVWQKNSNSNQKWAIDYFDGGKGYRIQSKSSGMSLDITGGSIANQINIEQYAGNSSNAQRWLFIPYEPQKTIEDGRYILTTGIDRHVELDVPGDTADVSDGANIRIWNDKCPSKFNSFDVIYVGNGYYNLVHAASGKYLEVNGSSTDNYGNIQLWSSNGANNQKWCIIPQNGGYMLVNRNSGLAMDIQDGKTEDATNVRQHYYNGSNAQTWFFEKAEYSVSYNANGGTKAPAQQVKYYNEDLTLQEDVPERSGYKFLGWADGDATATAAAFVAGGKYTVNKDTTLYAVWEDLNPDLILPSSLKKIEEEAFKGGAFKYVVLPVGVTSIESKAFADCPNLKNIYIPEATGAIADNAFEGVDGMTIHGKKDSYAEFYAQKHGYGFVVE